MCAFLSLPDVGPNNSVLMFCSIRRNERYPTAYCSAIGSHECPVPQFRPIVTAWSAGEGETENGDQPQDNTVSLQSCAGVETADCSFSLCQQPHLVFTLRTCGAIPPHRIRFSTGPSVHFVFSLKQLPHVLNEEL